MAVQVVVVKVVHTYESGVTGEAALLPGSSQNF
jgi:hypothetical protein